jgi:hypothetical protein
VGCFQWFAESERKARAGILDRLKDVGGGAVSAALAIFLSRSALLDLVTITQSTPHHLRPNLHFDIGCLPLFGSAGRRWRGFIRFHNILQIVEFQLRASFVFDDILSGMQLRHPASSHDPPLLSPRHATDNTTPRTD